VLTNEKKIAEALIAGCARVSRGLGYGGKAKGKSA